MSPFPRCSATSEVLPSTVLSQLTMTLGGSRFPGALGAMLIEILPFLRGIGSDIESALGNESPALMPTVMFAYALTSFLIGILFFALGACKAGRLVCGVLNKPLTPNSCLTACAKPAMAPRLLTSREQSSLA